MLIIGDREVESATVNVRCRDGKNLAPMSVPEFVTMVTEQCAAEKDQ